MISNYLRNQKGNFSLIFALGASVLLLGAGAAIDLNNLNHAKLQAQNTLDTAVMAAAREYQKTSHKAKSIETGSVTFTTNCPRKICTNQSKPAINIAADHTTSGRYEGNVSTMLMGIFGYKTLDFAVESQVLLGQTYYEYHFLMDVSASTGIGANQNSINDLKALTKDALDTVDRQYERGCAFACHETEGWEVGIPGYNSFPTPLYSIANNSNISLREDMMAETINLVVDQVVDETSSIAFYLYSDSLERVLPPTKVPGNIESYIKNATIRRWSTRPDLIKEEFSNFVGQNFDGSSLLKPRKTIVLITDGVNNKYGEDVTWAFDPSWCESFKEKGIQMIVAHIEYPKLNDNVHYKAQIRDRGIDKQVPVNLQACASGDLYIKGPGDSKTMKDIAQLILESRDLAFSH